MASRDTLLDERLRTAGWFPGRAVDVPDQVPSNHPAAALLAEFGFIRLYGAAGWPIVEFEWTWGGDDLVPRWEAELQTRLVGVAMCEGRHADLYMDERGRLFGTSVVHEAFWFAGANINEALTAMLAGQRWRMMLLRDQHSVTAYGRIITRDDTDVLTAETLPA